MLFVMVKNVLSGVQVINFAFILAIEEKMPFQNAFDSGILGKWCNFILEYTHDCSLH